MVTLGWNQPGGRGCSSVPTGTLGGACSAGGWLRRLYSSRAQKHSVKLRKPTVSLQISIKRINAIDKVEIATRARGKEQMPGYVESSGKGDT